MLKLITISCIIVVTLNFQEVEGFDLPLVPDMINKSSNILPTKDLINPSIIKESDISNIIDNISKFDIDDVVKGFQNKIKSINLSCLKVYTEGNELINNLSNVLNSCLKERTEILASDKNAKKWNEVVNNFIKALRENVRNTLLCLQQCPLNVSACLNVKKNISTLNIAELITAAKSEVISMYPLRLISTFPDILICGEKLIHEFKSNLVHTFLTDAKQCIQTITHII